MEVHYICDRKQCGENCSYPLCKHTSDVTHAANFEKRVMNDDSVCYFEKEDMPVRDAFERLQETLRRLGDIHVS